MKKSLSVSQVKKSIRDTKRLINHSPSPALESKLDQLNDSLAQLQSQAHKLKIQQKYKYVKFVEKKKLNRKLKTLESTGSAATDELRLHLAYIDHFPTDLKYISILNNGSTDAVEKQTAILSYLNKIKEETGSWPVNWEYSKEILGITKDKKEMTDDFFLTL